MESPFKRVAILGAGLLGGSLAMALRSHCPDVHVRLWARREPIVQLAALRNVADFCSCDLAEVVKDCDLIVFSTPVGVMLPLAQTILPFISSDSVLTDVGSVKRFVHESLGSFCKEHSLLFVGSHPMAGSEKQGLEHASFELFHDATVVVTGEESEELHRVNAFWLSVGSFCVHMSPQEHDKAVSAISHMPHAMAAICAMAAGDCGNSSELGQLAAGGFRDTTRVAMGDPAMWAEILMENSQAVMNSMQCCLERMDELCGLLNQKDQKGLTLWLKQAGKRREEIIRSSTLPAD